MNLSTINRRLINEFSGDNSKPAELLEQTGMYNTAAL
jgi:hypothetical protein